MLVDVASQAPGERKSVSETTNDFDRELEALLSEGAEGAENV